ncbi:MAG: hypothetical protein ORN56_03840 [Chitinophagales bacterium]|jgi:Spy/CpxP family protein refolding chaperone|nr:hypothetical protein [Chitinophagales bacterium]
MDYISKYKLLLRLVILLFILNGTTIGFIVWHKYNKPKREPHLFKQKERFRDVSGILKKELNLDKNQMQHFESVREKYYQKEVQLASIIKAEKDSMNAIMFNKVSDENYLKQLAHRIAGNEEAMELLRIEQAKELKTICNEEQQAKFENLVKEIRDYFRPDNRPNQK